MATYLKVRQLLTEGELKRAYWIHGTDRLLVEKTIDHIKSLAAVHDTNYVVMEAGRHKDREIQAAINQYPVDPLMRRLVIVRDAQKIKATQLIVNFLDSRHIPQVTAVFVDAGETRDNPDHVARITKSGRTVKCSPSGDDAVSILALHADIQHHDAAEVLQHLGRLDLALSAADKAKIVGVPLTLKTALVLETPSPSADFVECLSSLRKSDALALIELIPEDDYLKTFSFLTNRTLQLLQLYRLTRRQLSTREIMEVTDTPSFLLPKLLPLCKHYDRDSSRRRLALLMSLDNEAVLGTQHGLLDVLVTAW